MYLYYRRYRHLPSLINTNNLLVDNRTLVPLRFVSEALGANVEWVATEHSIHISIFKIFYDKYFQTTFSGDVLREYSEDEFYFYLDNLSPNQEIVNTSLN